MQGIVQGSGIDSSLNEFGQSQAAAFFNAFQNVPFDKIYTSVLKRSIQSVQRFIDKGVPHESHKGLNEINWGNKEGQRITPEEDTYYHWLLKQWEDGNTSLKIEGGESPEDVATNQRPVIEQILGRTEERNILICMHGRAIRVLLCQLLHYPLHAMDLFEHKNLCLYQLNFTGTMCSVERYNDTSHLKHLKIPVKEKV